MTAPSIKEALEQICQRANETGGTDTMALIDTIHAMHRMAKAALATFQPDGERREAIARIICYWDEPSTCHDNYCVFSCRAKTPDARFFKAADAILASGLVQNEAAIALHSEGGVEGHARAQVDGCASEKGCISRSGEFTASAIGLPNSPQPEAGFESGPSELSTVNDEACWRDSRTAPKDGTVIFVRRDNGCGTDYMVVWWNDTDNEGYPWQSDNNAYVEDRWDEWMLPPIRSARDGGAET